jgi:N-acylneuraminate cytidylyltransferase/CMP-N,N'-diacetyllegionaminic acid synthase
MRREEEKITKVAIIPARGGSARLENKNIYPLGGKPLICHTVESVMGSGCFDSVIVSTDSNDIADAVSEYDVEIHKRNPRYATDRATVLEALLAMMEEVPKHHIFAYFLPTCPFRNSEDIKRGLNLLTDDVDSVVSIVEYSDPIQLAMIKAEGRVLPVFDNLTSGTTNSRYFRKYYRPNGAFYMAWWDKLLKNRNFFVGTVKGYEMPKDRSLDINDIIDIMHAEALLKKVDEGENVH